MAWQDGIISGFRGKLGDVVGMRYRGGYTVREYVIPRDPESPAQMAHREMFALASRLSVESRQINGNNGEWDTSRMSEYAARLKQAFAHLAAGETPEQAFPLHPNGWNPPFQIKLASAAVNAITQTAEAIFTQLDGFAGQWLELGFTARNSAGETTATKAYPRTLISATPPLSYTLTFEDIDFGDTDTVDFGAKVYATETGTADLIDLDGIFATYTPKPQPHIAISSGTVNGQTLTMTAVLAQLSDAGGKWLEFSFIAKNSGGTITATKIFPRSQIPASPPLTYNKTFEWLDFADTATVAMAAKIWDTQTGGTVAVAASTADVTFTPQNAPTIALSSGKITNATLVGVATFSSIISARGRWMEFYYAIYNEEGEVIFSGTLPRQQIGADPSKVWGFDLLGYIGLSGMMCNIEASVFRTETETSAPLAFSEVGASFIPMAGADFKVASYGQSSWTDHFTYSITFPLGAVGLHAYLSGVVEDYKHEEIGELNQEGFTLETSGASRTATFYESCPAWRYVSCMLTFSDDETPYPGEIQIFFTVIRT